MITAKDVAQLFLRLSEPEVGDLISNLKLQKLVYYAQGFHIALYDKPFFEDPIVAWEHGPVVEELYHEYKQHGGNAIPVPDEDISTEFTEEHIELISEIRQIYGQFSAWKLRNMTHSESPWIETPKNGEIDHNKLNDFFKTLIHEQEAT